MGSAITVGVHGVSSTKFQQEAEE